MPPAGVTVPPVDGSPAPGGTPSATGSLTVVRDQQPAETGQPVRGGTLRLIRPGSIGEPGDYSPSAMRQDQQVAVSYLDPLLRPDPETMEPRPWLAERWSWSPDHTVVTFGLRRDVMWHDGTPFTAADVAFTLTVYRDDVESGVRNFFALMAAVEVVDDWTVRVLLDGPDGGWLLNASTQLMFQRAQYETYWQENPVGERTLSGYDWTEHRPIGTGPWKLGEPVAGKVRFERNDAYWAGAPYFDDLEIARSRRTSGRIRAWRRGEADVLWPLAPGDLDQVSDRDGRLFVADAASVMFAAFNFASSARDGGSIFGDLRVRQALSLGIDRGQYARSVFKDYIREEAVGTIAQPWAHYDSLTSPAADPVAARSLLRKAGWVDRDKSGLLENIDGVPLALAVIARDGSRPELVATLENVARQLKKIGISLDVASLPPDEFRERWTVTRDYDLIAYAFDLYPGFTDFDLYGSGWDIRVNSQGWNPGGYRNAEVDDAVDAALAAVDLPAQRNALVELQRAVNDDLFALWLGFPQTLILAQPDLHGFTPNTSWQTWDTRLLWREL